MNIVKIQMKQGFPQVDNYKVMVQCCTYNQSQYIEDTLKGFAIQQTNFPFVCCVFDDASTDGEQEVLKRWIENHCNPNDVEVYDHPLTIILMALDKNNPNCIYALHLQKVNTYGKPERQEMMAHWEKQCKYIALCEGDDYWIDPLKLQKQVDFLDTNSDFSLHTTNSMIIGEHNIEVRQFSNKESRIIKNMSEIVIERQFHTASVLLRSSCLNEHGWDTYMWCSLLTQGKLWYDNTLTCVYRKAGQGVTDSTLRMKWIEINEDWSNILYEKFGEKYLSYTAAYLSLTRDILAMLCLNKNIASLDKKILKDKYKKYSNFNINIKNIPYLLKLNLHRLVQCAKRYMIK